MNLAPYSNREDCRPPAKTGASSAVVAPGVAGQGVRQASADDLRAFVQIVDSMTPAQKLELVCLTAIRASSLVNRRAGALVRAWPFMASLSLSDRAAAHRREPASGEGAAARASQPSPMVITGITSNSSGRSK